MRFEVRRNKDFEGTDWVEIGPGKYGRKHWLPGFIFVREEDFFVAEHSLYKNLPKYDHFEINDIDGEIGLVIVGEWTTLANDLTEKQPQVWELRESKGTTEAQEKYLEENQTHIIQMLTTLAAECEKFCAEVSGFCVLGL